VLRRKAALSHIKDFFLLCDDFQRIFLCGKKAKKAKNPPVATAADL